MEAKESIFKAIVCKNFTYAHSEKLKDKEYSDLLSYLHDLTLTGHCKDLSTEDFKIFEWTKDHIDPSNGKNDFQKRFHALGVDFIVVFANTLPTQWIKLERF